MVEAEKIIEKADEEREFIRSLLPEAAEFFHGHESSLFERQEAIERLSDHLEVEEDVASRLLSGLVADEVDPVVQVRTGEERYVGVIDYRENGFYYSYTDWNDVEEERRINVCVRCVKNEEFDQDVFRVAGDDPEEELREHISRDHSVSPAEIETGAKLLSGTTIAGNTAFHAGNDGPGSGLDADLINSGHASGFARVSSPASTLGEQKGWSVKERSKFDPTWTTSGSLTGLGVDGSDCIWHADEGDTSIYQLSGSSTLTQESAIDSPGSSPGGVAVDSSGHLWNSDANSIHKIKQNFFKSNSFGSPDTDPEGLGVDSGDCLWVSDGSGTSIYKVNPSSGSTESQFDSPGSTGPQGVGVDSSDCIWNADDDTSIYQVNPSSPGTPDSQINSPGSSPQGVGVDSSDCIWNADSGDGSIYQVDQTGSVQSSFASPSTDPEGVDVDSNGCIWNTDPTAGSIYKLNQKGNLRSQFAAPGPSTTGIGTDSGGSVWSTDRSDDSVYRLEKQPDDTGASSQFHSGGSSPEGLAFDDSNCLWNADSGDNSVYRLEKKFSQINKFDPCAAAPEGLGVDSNGCLWVANDAVSQSFIARYKPDGTFVESFNSPGNSPRGVAVNPSTGCIWNVDMGDDSIYELDKNGNTTSNSFAAPGPSGTGLGIDSDNCLWHADRGDESIYKINPSSGNTESQFPTPGSNIPTGLGVDSSGCLWHADATGTIDSLYKLDRKGRIRSQMEAPGASPHGMGVDSSGSIWNADSETNAESVYEFRNMQTVSSIAAPGSSPAPRGLGFGKGTLWVSDDSNCIFKFNNVGGVVSQWSSPSSAPEGVGFRSNGCLWHADNSGSIYKLFPSAVVFRNL